jgi:hypothetical protein
MIGIIAFFIIIFCSLEAHAGDINEIMTGGARILFPPSLIQGAEEIARMYPGVKDETTKRLGIDLKAGPTVYLAHNEEFRRMTGGVSLVTAFAVPGADRIVINYSEMKNSSLILKSTLMHELCHLMLHDYIDSSLLPKWFDEGVCQWVSGGMADIINFDNKKVLKEATITNSYIPLNVLRDRFPSQDKALMLSYAESRSIIEYIHETYGREGVLLIIEALHRGRTIDGAVREVLSVTLKGLEKNWHAYLKRRYTWYYFVADNILWIVFIFGALITFAGYIRMRIRMRRHFKEDEEEPF